MDPESLIDFLVQCQGGDRDRASQLHKEFEDSHRELFDFLAASGFGERQEILQCLASEQGRDFVDLDRVSMPLSLLSSFDPDIMRIFECLPIEVSDGGMKLCLADPFDVSAIRELTAIFGKPVEVVIADPRQIREKVVAYGERETRTVHAGVVAASLGHTTDQTKNPQESKRRKLSSLLVVALAVLAASATAASALFLSQSKRLAQWKELVAQHETLLRQFEAMHKGAEVSLLQLESDLETLEGLLVKREVDAIRVDALEKDLRQLRGKIDSLGKILTTLESASAEEVPKTAEVPNSP
jgi:hypothetical protein